MSVRSLENDLGFVQEFQDHVVQIIAAINGWERIDAAVVEQAREDGHPDEVCPDEDQSRKIREYKEVYWRLRTIINLETVRLRNIASRYQLTFSDNWLYNIPTEHRPTPTSYCYSLNKTSEAAIIRDIELVRGAVSDSLRTEKCLEARRWYVKFRDDYLLPTAVWFVKPDHSKWTLIAVLIIVVAIALRLLGYDAKTIVDVAKALRG